MARSERFRQLVADIMGADSTRQGSNKTGISTTYLWRMRNDGQVPTPEVLAKFVTGYGIDEAVAGELADALAAVGKPVDPETLIHIACQLAGFNVRLRLRVLECFRQQQVEQAKFAAA